MPGPQQEIMALRTVQADLAKEHTGLSAEVEDWNRKIEKKKEIIAALEKTVVELKNPDCQRDGLVRCSAEFEAVQRAAAMGLSASASAVTNISDVDEEEKARALAEFNLSQRVADAIARGPLTEAPTLTFGDSGFENEFGAGRPQEESLQQMSAEERLFWELRHPIKENPRLDQALCAELKQAGRTPEIDVLVASVGPPTAKERQYRPLLWLWKHTDLQVNFLDPSSHDGASLLILACCMDFPDVCHELVRRGADVQHVDKSGRTAIVSACHCRSWGCVRILLENGASANEEIDGTRLLTWAAGLENTAGVGVQLLLDFGAESCTVGPDGRTPLMVAAAKGDDAACSALLSARADPNAQEGSGQTAAQLAAGAGHASLAQRLGVGV